MVEPHGGGSLTQALAIALVAADLSLYAVSFTPTAPRRLYRQRPQVVGVLQEDTALFRKATWLASSNDQAYREAQHTLAMSWAMVHGIDDVNGFNSLQPRRYTDYVFGPRVDDVSYRYLRDERLLRADNPVLSSLNVRYVIVPSGDRLALGPHLRPIFEGTHARVYENTRAYPRRICRPHPRRRQPVECVPPGHRARLRWPARGTRRERIGAGVGAATRSRGRRGEPPGTECARRSHDDHRAALPRRQRNVLSGMACVRGWRRDGNLPDELPVSRGRRAGGAAHRQVRIRPASVLTGAVLSLAALAVRGCSFAAANRSRRCLRCRIVVDPRAYAGLYHVERQRPTEQEHIVKLPDIEPLAELLLGFPPQRAEPQLADLVRERLAGPGDIAFELRLDVVLR